MIIMRTVGDLREALANTHDDQRIEFVHHENPGGCCDCHEHDITDINGCDVDVDISPGLVTITVSGGYA